MAASRLVLCLGVCFLVPNVLSADSCSRDRAGESLCSTENVTPDQSKQPKKMERTFIMIKPDGVQRSLVGEIIKRFEAKGYKLVAAKFMQATEELLQTHYAEHEGKPFYEGLLRYIMSGPVVPMVWEGKGVVATGRTIIGATNPLSAPPGTIRGDYGISVGRNIIHGSDSEESAQREISIWFQDGELVDWESTNGAWIYE